MKSFEFTVDRFLPHYVAQGQLVPSKFMKRGNNLKKRLWLISGNLVQMRCITKRQEKFVSDSCQFPTWVSAFRCVYIFFSKCRGAARSIILKTGRSTF